MLGPRRVRVARGDARSQAGWARGVRRLLFLCALGMAVTGVSAASASAQGLAVYAGYADNVRAAAVSFPTPFGPGTGIIYDGCVPVAGTGACSFDGGTVRLVNTGFSPITVDSTTIDFGGCVYDMWQHSTTIPGGGQLILAQQLPGSGDGCTVGTQTAAATMDSSDFGPSGAMWSGNCTQSGVIPTVTVTVAGMPTTYNDTGQILNTGGVDAASCSGSNASNEAEQWTEIGSPPCPTAALTLTPSSQKDAINTSATVTAHLQNSCGQPLSGVPVDFSGTGPNAPISGSGTTDLSGNAMFSYTGTKTGTDTLSASVSNLAGTIDSGSVTVTWEIPKRGGTFSCTAKAVKLAGVPLVSANPGDTPCASDAKSLVGLPPLVGALNAFTDLKGGSLPAAGDHGYAYASAASVNILGIPGHSISVGAVTSEAEVRCVAGSTGMLSEQMFSDSTVATITIDGYRITVGGGPAKLSIAGIATVWLNRTITTANGVEQRAVEVDLLGIPIAIVADSKVDSTGSPCNTILVP